MKLSIFDVQRFSVQDGPGIRTTVFLKGCVMRCRWCHNPESLEQKENLLYYSEKCIGCKLCVDVCSAGVHQFKDSVHLLNRGQCRFCGNCVKICPECALEIAGEQMEEGELLKRVIRDRKFYASSGGGVTFSGGEPLLQAEKLRTVLRQLKEQNIHTAIETCSNVPWEHFSGLLKEVDLWICDLKAVTPFIHQQGTGCSNERILENLQRLAKEKKTELWIRVPVIPGFNDTEQEIRKIAVFINELGDAVKRVEVMAYHDTGKSKYAALGWEYLMGEKPSMTREEAAPFRGLLERNNDRQ